MTLEEMFGLDADDGGYADFPYLLLEADEELLVAAQLPLDEARDWRPSKVKGLLYRVDPASEKLRQKRHVHIAAGKHRAAKTKQVSWNDEGGRHDRHTFNVKLGKRADYQQAARLALGLSPDAVLENVEPTGSARLMSLAEAIMGSAVEDPPLKIRAVVGRRKLLDDDARFGLPD